MIPPELLQTLMQAIVLYRVEKGFEPASWHTAGARFACIAAEIWEVEEAIGEEDMQHVRDELAGVAMYILGTQIDLGIAPGTARTSLMRRVRRHASPAEITSVLREHWRAAFESWRKHDTKDTTVSLDILLAAVFHIRNNVLKLPGSLVEDCLACLAAGAERPWRHGNKHPLT